MTYVYFVSYGVYARGITPGIIGIENREVFFDKPITTLGQIKEIENGKLRSISREKEVRVISYQLLRQE